MKKKFKARNGAPFSVKDAQKIGEELEDIKKKGNLTPPRIIERAKSKKSILNRYFEWEDTKAAEKWRLQQARNITGHIIEVVVIKGESVEEKAYFSVVTKNNETSYVSLSEAISTSSYRKQLLNEMETTSGNLLRIIKLFSSME